MSKVEGSYSTDMFSDVESEVTRLGKQQSSFQSLEVQHLRSLGIKENSSILEIGSGTGHVSQMLKSLIPHGYLLSIDKEFESEWISRMKTSEEENDDNNECQTELLVGDAYQILPNLTQRFDFCYLRFVLQHVPHPEDLLKLVYKCLKPDGKVIIVDSDDQLSFCYPHSEEFQKLLAKAQEAQTLLGGDRFIGQKLPHLLKKTGFSKSQTQSITFTHSQMPFEQLWHLNIGYKSSLLPNCKDDFINLAECLKDYAQKGELFYHVGIMLSIGIKS